MEQNRPAVRIGEILKELGMVSAAELDEALELARAQGLRLGEALVHLGFLDEDRLTWALGAQFDLSYVDLQFEMIDWTLFQGLSFQGLLELGLVPLSRVGNTITVVTSDPAREGLMNAVAELFPHDRVVVQMSSEAAILKVINEADRLFSGQSIVEADRSSGISARPDELLGLLDSAVVGRVVVLKEPGEQYGRLVGEASAAGLNDRLSPAAMERFLDALKEEFVLERSLPGGFIGLRPANPLSGCAAVRAVTLTGAAGWLAALERLPGPKGCEEGHFTYLASETPLRAKAWLMSTLADAEVRAPVISLEGRIDFLVSNIFQAEISCLEERVACARHLYNATRPGLMILEAELVNDVLMFDVPRLKGAGPFVVIARGISTEFEASQIQGPHRLVAVKNEDDVRRFVQELAKEKP